MGEIRVIRLGEFSPFGGMFTLDSFSKITKVAKKLWATIFHG
jgi:hypothetical protein